MGVREKGEREREREGARRKSVRGRKWVGMIGVAWRRK